MFFNIRPKEFHFVKIIIVICFIGLTACSASGPRYLDVVSTFPPISSGNARVFFLRPYKVYYAAADVRLTVNGALIGKCPNNAFFYEDFPKGSIVIVADYWGATGSYMIQSSIEDGKMYYVLLGPREANVNATLLFGAIGQLVESSASDIGKDGPFQAQLIDSSQATEELAKCVQARN